MKSFGEFVSHLIEWMIGMAVVCAAVYFLGPIVWQHGWAYIQAGEAAKATVHAQADALGADTVSANHQQASCSTEIARTQKADAAIAAASRPVQPVAGQGQPLVTGDPLKAIFGIDQ